MAVSSIFSRKSLDEDAPKVFSYKVATPSGVVIKDKMRANSKEGVVSVLVEKGFYVLEVKDASGEGINTDIGVLFNRPVKFTLDQKVAFTTQFYHYQKSGTKLAESLAALGQGAEPRIRDMCTDLSEMVASGKSLTESLSKYPGCFDDVYIAYVSAAEHSGQLLETLDRLTKMLKREAEVVKNIKAASAYPKYVSVAVVLIVIGIISFLVPKFTAIYASLGSSLPAPTLLLVKVSKHIIPIMFPSYWGIRWNTGDFLGLHVQGFALGFHVPIIFGIPFPPIPIPNIYSPIAWIILAYIGVKYYLKINDNDPKLGILRDKIRYGVPIMGKLSKYRDLFRWASTLAGALQSSITIPEALELAARTSGSRWQMAIVEDLKSSVRGGKTLSESLEDYPDLFPVNLRVMVKTGENSGNIAELLQRSAEALDADIELMTTTLGARLEVALIVVMGAVIGGILIVLYLPILNIDTVAAQSLQNHP